MSDDRLQRALQRIQAPDELEAQRRAWPVVHAAFEQREQITWPRRRARPLIAAAAVVVVLAAALSSPGRALVGDVRDAFDGSETTKPRPALTSLPASGPLLVNSATGPWIVQPDGSKRKLGAYAEGSWSPHALHVAVTRGHELAALTPEGVVRWSLARSGAVRGARWSLEDVGCCRIAYLNGRALRVVGGDGRDDSPLRRLVAPTPPAWRPGADHELAFSTVEGRIELVQTDTTKTIWRTVPGEVPRELVWSGDGTRLLVLSDRSLRVLDARGRRLWTVGLPVGPSGVAFVRGSHRFVMIRYVPATGLSDLVLRSAEAEPGEARFLYSAAGEFRSLVMSPNGRWLLVGWVNADQWIFLRLTAARVHAVSNIAEQFGSRFRIGADSTSFPTSVSWCCPASP